MGAETVNFGVAFGGDLGWIRQVCLKRLSKWVGAV